jgi:3-oxoacyl-[acyl-carrier protein] reductase
MELKGCAPIVTGGSGGLGQRICRALAINGVNVVVNYVASEAKAQGVAEQLVTFCRSDSVTGQTVVMDCGRF